MLLKIEEEDHPTCDKEDDHLSVEENDHTQSTLLAKTCNMEGKHLADNNEEYCSSYEEEKQPTMRRSTNKGGEHLAGEEEDNHPASNKEEYQLVSKEDQYHPARN